MKIIGALIIALCVSACATVFGVDPARLDSANKALAAATVRIEALALISTDLVAEGVITPTQGRAISSNLRTALDAVQKAKDAVQASGDPTQADAALEIAERSIDVTLRLLQSFAPKQSAIFEREKTWKPLQSQKYFPVSSLSFGA